MNKQTIIIIILSVVIAGLLLFYGYNYLGSRFFNDGYLAGQVDLIIDMNNRLMFPALIEEGNETSVLEISLNEICDGG